MPGALDEINFCVYINKGGCSWIWFGCKEATARYEIFVVAALMGGGGTAMLICSLTMVASLVGNNIGSPQHLVQ